MAWRYPTNEEVELYGAEYFVEFLEADDHYAPVARELGYDLEETFDGVWFVVYAGPDFMLVRSCFANYDCAAKTQFKTELVHKRFLPAEESASPLGEPWCSTHGDKCFPLGHDLCGEIGIVSSNRHRYAGLLSSWRHVDPMRFFLADEFVASIDHDGELMWANGPELAVALGWPEDTARLFRWRDNEFAYVTSMSREKIIICTHKESRGVRYTLTETHLRRGLVTLRTSWCRCGSRHSFVCPFAKPDIRVNRPKIVAAEPVKQDRERVIVKEIHKVEERKQGSLF